MSLRVVNLLPILVFSLVIFHLSESAFVNLKVYENEWLKKVLNEPLNNVHVRATVLNTSEPIEISASIVVRNFGIIDEKKQEFSIQITLRQEYEDDRLAYEKFNPVQLRQLKHLTLLETEKIWTPDTYIKNEKKSSLHLQMKPNNFARIYANGTIVLDTRLSVTLACPLNLRYYPFDTPICRIQLASYAFARDDLIYKWKSVTNPITMSGDAVHPQEYTIQDITFNYCDSQAVTGVHSCLVAEFRFKRSSRFYLKQFFIPILNLVIVTWFSFLLDHRSEKTFLLRGLICLVTLSNAFAKMSSLSEQLPRVNSTTALDVWNGISLTFIFVALAEFIFIHYLSTHELGIKEQKDGSEASSKSSKRNSALEDIEMARTKIEGSLTIEPENFEVERKKSVESVKTHWSKKIDPEKIEKWTIILYPSLYTGFMAIFWLVCYNSGDNDH